MKQWILGLSILLLLTGCDRLRVGETKIKVEVRDTEAERARGLSGRESLGEDEGMLFVFEKPGIHGFWMKEMKFGLDFIWIRDNKVIEVTENVGVERMDISPFEAVDKVLEVNSGFAAKHSIKVGDSVK